MKAILITGSRALPRPSAVRHVMDLIHGEGHDRIVLIHGHCPRGADAVADAYGTELGWSVVPMPAQWDRDGRRAGPKRNWRMLSTLEDLRLCGWDCEVHAFPHGESKGTRHMMELADAAGLTVHNHEAQETKAFHEGKS